MPASPGRTAGRSGLRAVEAHDLGDFVAAHDRMAMAGAGGSG